MTDFSTLGQRLKSLVPKGVSTDWYKEFGSSKSSFHEYVREERVPKVDILIRLHEVLGTDLYWLLTGKSLRLEPLQVEVLATCIAKAERLKLAKTASPEEKAELIAEYYKEAMERALNEAFSQAILRDADVITTENGHDTHSKGD